MKKYFLKNLIIIAKFLTTLTISVIFTVGCEKNKDDGTEAEFIIIQQKADAYSKALITDDIEREKIWRITDDFMNNLSLTGQTCEMLKHAIETVYRNALYQCMRDYFNREFPGKDIQFRINKIIFIPIPERPCAPGIAVEQKIEVSYVGPK